MHAKEHALNSEPTRAPKLPPAWFEHAFWHAHRLLHRLNPEAHPEAVVHVAGQSPRRVRAIRVTGAERDRRWRRWLEIEPEIQGYADSRGIETPVVVLESVSP